MTTFTTIGYGDVKPNSTHGFIFVCVIEFIGVQFFGYIIGNISRIIDQDDSITELKELYQKDVYLWIVKLAKSNKEKAMAQDYYSQTDDYFMGMWDKDHFKLKSDPIFNQLKPKLQVELMDVIFKNIYSNFHIFFKDLEEGFRREIVRNMQFESYNLFEPYSERYKDDKKSFPAAQRNFIFPSGK